MKKQETLEEAAKKHATGKSSSPVFQAVHTLDFIAGALWQQQQDKKMYSEEDVRNLFNQYKEKFSLYRNIQILPAVFEEWFKNLNNK
jgi:hypothetical protein